MKKVARRVLKGLNKFDAPEIKDNNSSTHDRVFWVTLSDGTKKRVVFPSDVGEAVLAEGMSDVERTSSIPSNDIARESAVRATNAGLPTVGEVAATRRDRRIEEERANPNYYEDKEKEYTLLAVEERTRPYNWMLTAADGLGTFRRALGAVTSIPLFSYIGLPISAGNAVVDRFIFNNPEAANEDLEGALITAGLDRVPAFIKAAKQWKPILPAVRFVNGKVVAPVTTWATTKLYPWMLSAATRAKKLLPSWKDSATDAANASGPFNWHFELTPNGKLVLVNTPVESSVFYSPDKSLETYAVDLFNYYNQHPESFKGIAEGLQNVFEGKTMAKLVIRAWNDMIKYLRSPRVKAKIEELKKEAAANNYNFDINPEEYLKAAQHLEMNEFPRDLAGGVTAAVPNANTQGVMVLNLSSPLFTDTPYATVLHESAHLNGLGHMAKSLDGPEYLASLLFLYFKVGLFFGKRASSEEEIKQILLDMGCSPYYVDYFSDPSEFIAFGLSLGREGGLKLGQRYPGKAAAKKIIQKIGAKLNDETSDRIQVLSNFYKLLRKAGNSEENIKNTWDLLTGQYLFTLAPPAVVGVGLGLNNLNNNINNYGYETR